MPKIKIISDIEIKNKNMFLMYFLNTNILKYLFCNLFVCHWMCSVKITLFRKCDRISSKFIFFFTFNYIKNEFWFWFSNSLYLFILKIICQGIVNIKNIYILSFKYFSSFIIFSYVYLCLCRTYLHSFENKLNNNQI